MQQESYDPRPIISALLERNIATSFYFYFLLLYWSFYLYDLGDGASEFV
jgi:hypothetical protein